MSQILEAEAVIRARDTTGRVFEAVAGKIKTVSAAMQQIERVSGVMATAGSRAALIGKALERNGRAMSLGVTVPAALAARSVYSTIHEFELAGNKLKAFGDLSDAELARAKKTATELGQKYQFGPTGVLKGMVEEIKAGFEARHLEPIQQPLLDFATIAEIDVPKAAELAIFSLSGFGQMYDKTGKLLEGSQLNKNLREMVDLFAILNKSAPGNIAQIAETFKYAAPIAKNVGVSPDQLGAFTAVLAQSGILGSEAGTALRSMLVRFIKPPQNARAALSAAGLTFSDYVKINPDLLKPKAILSAVENFTGKAPGKKGGKMSVGQAPPVARALFMKRIAALEGLDGDDYVKGLTDVIRKTAGGGLLDAKIAGELATRIVGTAIEKIDVMSFLKDVFGKSANPSALMSLFMDQRQGARLSNLDSERILYMLNEMAAERERARVGGTSPSRKMAGDVNSGIIEAENRLRGAFERVKIAFSDPAILETVASTFENMAKVLKSLAETNPAVLQAGVYVAAAGAVWGPATLMLARLATVGGLILKGGAWLLPTAATAGRAAAAVAGGSAAAPFAAGAAVGLGAYQLYEASKPFAGMTLGERAAHFRGNRSVANVYRQQFAEDRAKMGLAPPLSLDGIRSALNGQELSGRVQIETTVKVEPSPDFITRAISSVRSLFGGNIKSEASTGSTGTSMPEALPGGSP